MRDIMSEDASTEKRGRRGGGRDARRTARSGGGNQMSAPYLIRKVPLYEILSDEGAEIIENNAETILEEIGIEF
jgi:trimethylamine--corrinoid protein Co-methyltransferase